MKLTKCFKTTLIIVLILAAYGIVGKMDYEDELKEQEHAARWLKMVIGLKNFAANKTSPQLRGLFLAF